MKGKQNVNIILVIFCRESEDTILLVLKEMYSIMNVSPDSQVQHAILPFDIHDDGSNYPTSMQFEEPPGFNMSYGSLSSLYDDKHNKLKD